MTPTIIYDTTTMMLFIWFFFILIAEWKKDFVYFIFCSAIAIILGVNMLYTGELHYIFGTVILLTSVYFSYLALVYGIKFYRRN